MWMGERDGGDVAAASGRLHGRGAVPAASTWNASPPPPLTWRSVSPAPYARNSNICFSEGRGTSWGAPFPYFPSTTPALRPPQPPATAAADASKHGANPGLPAVDGPPAGAPRPGVSPPPQVRRPSLLHCCLPGVVHCSTACHLPPPSPVPWLVLPDGSATSFPLGETFQLPDGVRHHTSCGDWLLLSRRDGSCFLMNQFTKATTQLPSLSSYSYYQERVKGNNMVLEVPFTWMENMDTGEMPVVLSLVVCSTRLIAAILAIGDLCTIALCRPGAASWSVSAHKGCMLISSMVFFQGKLYALDMVTSREGLITIDVVDEHDSDEPRVSRIGCLIEGDFLPYLTDSCYVRYLVESHGTLLMIRRKLSFKRQYGTLVGRCNDFEVFMADFDQRLWAEVRTLGNSQALFLGQRYSRAVHVSPCDISRDCIFFVDDCPNWLMKQTTESCGVYDMKDEKVYSPLPMVSWQSKEVPATWIFSQGETDKLQTE